VRNDRAAACDALEVRLNSGAAFAVVGLHQLPDTFDLQPLLCFCGRERRSAKESCMGFLVCKPRAILALIQSVFVPYISLVIGWRYAAVPKESQELLGDLTIDQ